ncbi:MAG: imidazolonepropionase [Candidatus Eisenbacteria bacterium]|nr:imidazolonepropionase [Candidatus Eisenbacteria bacterium]
MAGNRKRIEADTVISEAKELLTLSAKNGSGELGLIRTGTVAGKNGNIVAVGESSLLDNEILLSKKGKWIDAKGKLVMPGFVDCHTHALFAGSREKEFSMRLRGASYMEIREKGYGIRESVRQFKNASDNEIRTSTLKRLERMLIHGTTSVEIKSGYGLSFDDELRALRLIREVGELSIITVVATFLGAHDVPQDFEGRTGSYVELITQDLIPEVAKRGLAQFCDVFCEEGVFSVDESRTVLLEGIRHNLKPKLHADEFSDSGGALLAAEVSAVSADHLMCTGRAGMEKLLSAGVIPVLLPACSFSLGKGKYANGREMADIGLPVALATDLNPGSSMCESMQMVISLACVGVGLTPEEAIVGATRNAGHAAGLGREVGTLEPGKKFDCIILDVPSFEYIPYHFGGNHVIHTIKDGKVVASYGRLEKGEGAHEKAR